MDQAVDSEEQHGTAGEVSREPSRGPEHFDVLIVGAGLSGIGAAHRLGERCPWADYAVLESRGAVGGTWDLFRYPGIRSDSEMHTLGYPFKPWAGEKSIADGESIRDYIRETADEAGITERIRFRHRVVRAEWDSDEVRWNLTVQRLAEGLGDRDVPAEGLDAAATDARGRPLVETVRMSCSFLYSCTGYYRYDRGHQPEFEGIEDFTGRVIHPQFWPEDFDPAGQHVVVVGSGATAVTLVPALARRGASVTMLQRSPTYMASVPSINPLARLARRTLPERAWGPALKWLNATTTQTSYKLSRRHPELMRKLLVKGVAANLPEGYDVQRHFNPRYDPWDQRLCAVTDGDLFAAIRDGSAEVVTDTIDHFTEDGIVLGSGRELPADVVVTATGLDLLFMGGMHLEVDGEEVHAGERLAYRGMMLEGVPNAAMAVGYTNASWTLKADLSNEYVCRLLNHMHSSGLRKCMPVNRDQSMERAPLLDLNSGYVQRSADRFPSQGSADPWIMHQSYLTDMRAMRPESLHDGVMMFSDPDPRRPPDPGEGEAAAGRAPRHRHLDNLAGRVAAITGAGSGIGRALAVQLSREGCHLALCDVDEVGLAETVTLCEGAGVKVTSRRLDVSDREAVFAWADEVVAHHGAVNVVVNNAGVALGSTVEGTSVEDFRWLMDINFWGVVHGTQAFLPKLRDSGEGHVVNISSVFGLVSIPGQAPYNSSKFAVRGFTDSLRMELAVQDCGVSATTVHPGGIRTNIARSARVNESIRELGGHPDEVGDGFDRIARTTPEKAAAKIIEAVRRDRRRVLIGPDAVAIDLVSRLPARLYQGVLVRGARTQRSQ
ncbi:MAG: NAD(P)/FAD-dependent oxidoreductase [Microthrixaceae bacterium]|nr:NAD(P)/FAD-dependent oxidoreductase [Microthrixaceae bacterium]